MGIRKNPLVNLEYYHIYNRGNSKMEIFKTEDDYNRFIKMLFLCNSDKKINFRTDIVEKNIDAWDFEVGESIVSIGAWVLMPNHFHLYITGSRSKASGEKEDNISIFMQKLSTAYAKYFNAKYKRTGSLFEGKFKATLIKDEIQAKYLFSYIHLNPVKLIDPKWKTEGIKSKKETLDFLNKYQWSSYLDFKEKDRIESIVLNRTDFLNYFSNSELVDSEIMEWFSRSLASGEIAENQIFDLKKRMNQHNPEKYHNEIDWGKSVGKEFK